jgi:alpha-beta hydrolase superfamily lysophospholipase
VILGHWRWMFSDQTLRRAMEKAGEMGHFNPSDASAVNAIRHAAQPVLIMHSKTDELISVKQSERLYDAAPEGSELVLVDKQSHFVFVLESWKLIAKSSIGFFNKYVAPAPPSTQPQLADHPTTTSPADTESSAHRASEDAHP